MPEPEANLIARCRAGDAGAWDELFDRQYDPVGRFVFQLSPELSREDVEDICQDVFLAAVRSLGSFRGGSAVQTWLFRIALNKARDFIEKRRAAKRGGGRAPVSLDAPDPTTGLTQDLPDSGRGPAENLEAGERAVWIQEALANLGEPCREIIELRYFGDLSYEELAASFGITVKAAGSRLHKCLARLAEMAGARAMRQASPLDPV
jgi:RNA polymerase sigma-70 factor (ECF subfamily)